MKNPINILLDPIKTKKCILYGVEKSYSEAINKINQSRFIGYLLNVYNVFPQHNFKDRLLSKRLKIGVTVRLL